MKTFLKALSLVVILTTIITWLATGASRGWSKTSVPVKTLDPVTGIEGISYQSKFIAGVDFLGAGLIAGAVLGSASLFFRSKKSNQPNNQ
jgi:hypothetical protein